MAYERRDDLWNDAFLHLHQFSTTANYCAEIKSKNSLFYNVSIVTIE
jgi:hypothetical protein